MKSPCEAIRPCYSATGPTSLPTIKFGDEHIPLYTLRYFAEENSLKDSADVLIKKPRYYKKTVCGQVHCFASRLAPGRPPTSSCLCSCEPPSPITCTTSIEFNNNNHRNVVLSHDPATAANQGGGQPSCSNNASKNLQVDAGPYRTESSVTLTPSDILASSMEGLRRLLYLAEKLVGHVSRSLFHLDEHRRPHVPAGAGPTGR